MRSTLQMLSQQQNAKIVLVDPQPEGNIDPDTLCREVTGDTLLLSCNLVNSEMGAVSDLAAITRQAKRQNPKALVHTDGVQALGKVDFSLKKLGVDLRAGKRTSTRYRKRSACLCAGGRRPDGQGASGGKPLPF